MTYISTKLKREFIINEIITIHYFEYMKDFEFPGESHDFWEILYVDKGKITVSTGERINFMNSGDVIFHRPNEFHAIRSICDTAPNLVALSFQCQSPAMDFFNEGCFSLGMEERILISNIISEAEHAFTTPLHIPSVEQVKIKEQPVFGSEQLILLYLELFLIKVRRKYSEKSMVKDMKFDYGIYKINTDNSSIEQILSFMEFHLCDHLTVSMVCREFSMSRSALHALFKKEKDCGIIDWFNHMKLERAKEIMRNGVMNLTEIAHYLSYSSLQYFSKQFKNAYGMSPLEYSSSVKGITQAVKNADSRADMEKCIFKP